MVASWMLSRPASRGRDRRYNRDIIMTLSTYVLYRYNRVVYAQVDMDLARSGYMHKMAKRHESAKNNDGWGRDRI